MANRKLISWRIDSLSESDQVKLNAWLDQQQNIQKSITNVVMHTINQLGISDVMSFENQKRLYQDFAAGAPAPVAPVVIVKEPVSNEPVEPASVPHVEQIDGEKYIVQPDPEPQQVKNNENKNDDDIYGALGDL